MFPTAPEGIVRGCEHERFTHRRKTEGDGRLRATANLGYFVGGIRFFPPSVHVFVAQVSRELDPQIFRPSITMAEQNSNVRYQEVRWRLGRKLVAK